MVVPPLPGVTPPPIVAVPYSMPVPMVMVMVIVIWWRGRSDYNPCPRAVMTA